MDKFPLLREGRTAGEMTTCQDGEETIFSLECDLPREGLWNLWVVGDSGELRLGLPWNHGGRGRLEKRFSRRMTEPLGRLLRGEMRRVEEPGLPTVWHPIKESRFRTPWLAQQLLARPGVLWAGAGTERLVAVPYEPKKPFPVMPMFCFARLQQIREQPYLVLYLTDEELPRL